MRQLALLVVFCAACGSSSNKGPGDAGSEVDMSGGGNGGNGGNGGMAGGGNGGSDDMRGGGDSSDMAGGIVTGASGQWVLGYYVGYHSTSYPLAQIDWTGLTHIVVSPLLVKTSGSTYSGLNYEFDNFGSDADGQAWAKPIAAAAHAHGDKALLMLGGAGAGASIAIAANATNRAKFVADLLGALTTLGFDGLDLDWEDSIDFPTFIALAHDLRTSPSAPAGLVITVPGGAVNLGDTIDANIPKLAMYVDRYNLMTYGAWGMAGVGQGWCAWHEAPLSGAYNTPNANGCYTPRAIDESLAAYVKAGIPKAKLGMGLAFSAMCYVGAPYVTAPGQNTQGDTFGGGDNAYTLSDFFAAGSTFDKAGAAAMKRDTVAAVPYLSLTTPTSDAKCGGMTSYISYDDETSIIAKGTFSKANGYGGVIVWTIDQGWLPANASGGRAQNALMQALKTGFID